MDMDEDSTAGATDTKPLDVTEDRPKAARVHHKATADSDLPWVEKCVFRLFKIYVSHVIQLTLQLFACRYCRSFALFVLYCNSTCQHRYRPSTMDDLIAHEEIISIINRLIESGKLPHLLLYGPPGTGKVRASMIFEFSFTAKEPLLLILLIFIFTNLAPYLRRQQFSQQHAQCMGQGWGL